MTSISVFLASVHDTVHDFSMKHPYSEPKIYCGGVDPKGWSKLSKKEQKVALEKDWYVYFSFRSPETGKLKRQPNIKGGVNRYKNKRQRYSYLKTLQRNLLRLLEFGFNPYKDNTELAKTFLGDREAQDIEKVPTHSTTQNQPNTDSTIPKRNNEVLRVENAIAKALKIKKNEMSEGSFIRYKSRIGKFNHWLLSQPQPIEWVGDISRGLVMGYLDETLERTSARTRNNVRTDLSSLFQVWEDREIIGKNFIKSIRKLKTQPKRNKTYTPKLLEEIENYIKEEDPILMLFIQFVSYNFLRPIEVCRLRVKDLDLDDKKLYVRTKTKLEKTKIIPEILIAHIPDLSKKDSKDFLFTPDRIGGSWDTAETNKRNYFSKRFKKIKGHFELGAEYGLYSFRHTYITKIYRSLEKEFGGHMAKSKLLPITGHATMAALEKYLRDIDAQLPKDYSNRLE